MTAAEAFEQWMGAKHEWSKEHLSEYQLSKKSWLAAWTQAVAQTREDIIGEFVASCEVAEDLKTEQHILSVAAAIRAQEPPR